MSNEFRTVFKMFAVWQDDREEEWLREMARQGWHLVKPGLGTYTFRKGEPGDVVYRLDYVSLNNRQEKQIYYDLFDQSGWELVSSLGGWQYFRKPNRPGEVDEIYTDNQSKIQKHTRLIIILGVVLMFMGFNLINMGSSGMLARPSLSWITPLSVLVIALDLYALLRLYLRVRALQSSL